MRSRVRTARSRGASGAGGCVAATKRAQPAPRPPQAPRANGGSGPTLVAAVRSVDAKAGSPDGGGAPIGVLGGHRTGLLRGRGHRRGPFGSLVVLRGAGPRRRRLARPLVRPTRVRPRNGRDRQRLALERHQRLGGDPHRRLALDATSSATLPSPRWQPAQVAERARERAAPPAAGRRRGPARRRRSTARSRRAPSELAEAAVAVLVMRAARRTARWAAAPRAAPDRRERLERRRRSCPCRWPRRGPRRSRRRRSATATSQRDRRRARGAAPPTRSASIPNAV